jgi:hypothetical protein
MMAHMRLFSCVVVVLAAAACGGAEPVKPSQPKSVAAPVEPEEKEDVTPVEIVARFEDTQKDKIGFCRKQVGYDGPAETCSIEPVGNNSAAVVRMITQCSGESCKVKGWLLRNELPPLPLPPAIDPAGNIETDGPVSQIVGERIQGGDKEWTLELRAFDLKTQKTTTLAACIAPRLSPGDRFFTCRDRAGNLLRVPVKGGKLDVVAKSGVAADQVDWAPAGYVYPGPATFPTEKQVAFETELIDDNPVQKTAPWSE